jgi:hypothetical protein
VSRLLLRLDFGVPDIFLHTDTQVSPSASREHSFLTGTVSITTLQEAIENARGAIGGQTNVAGLKEHHKVCTLVIAFLYQANVQYILVVITYYTTPGKKPVHCTGGARVGVNVNELKVVCKQELQFVRYRKKHCGRDYRYTGEQLTCRIGCRSIPGRVSS